MLDKILGKDIAYYVKRYRGLIAIAVALTAVSSFFAVVPAYLIQPFIDEGMMIGSDAATLKIPWLAFEPGSSFSLHRTELVLIESISQNLLLLLLAFVAFISILFRSITVYFSQLIAASFSNQAIKALRIDLYDKLISLDLGFYHKHKAGELVSRSTADLTVMQERIANIIIGLIQHPLTALFFLIFVIIMDYRLTLIVCIAAPLIVGLIRLFGRKVKKHSTRVQSATAHVTSAYQETLLCLKVVQGFCMGRIQSKNFRELANFLYKKVMHWNRWFLGLGPLMDSTLFLILPLVLMLGKIYFGHSLGGLIAMFFAFSRVYSPVKNLARLNNELRTLQGATDRVFSIMKTESDIKEKADARILQSHRESIEFRNVDFSFQPGNPILHGIDFKIRAGEMIAIVGSTGAGKSTLLDLIPRFYDVSNGSILIDGTDIRDVTIESLRDQIGIVSQEVLLFHDSIANNISCGNSGIEFKKIEQATRAAHAHKFIMAQPGQYETIVGDRGTLLSGGQKQRIAIARAILRNPSILLLDEVASALDAESEGLIQKAIEGLRGDKTIVVVAHRLSTIRTADRIYVLEGGRIVESGRHEELISLNGRFRQLHDMQFSVSA